MDLALLKVFTHMKENSEKGGHLVKVFIPGTKGAGIKVGLEMV